MLLLGVARVNGGSAADMALASICELILAAEAMRVLLSSCFNVTSTAAKYCDAATLAAVCARVAQPYHYLLTGASSRSPRQRVEARAHEI